MIKKFLLLTLIIIVSCKQKIEHKQLSNLNGYWEIEKAIDANGKQIDYKINETIDFISVKNNIGFRKKVMPQLNGKFKINPLQENIKIIEDKSEVFLEYSTTFSNWREEIVSISDNNLVLKNDQNITYYYKKHIPFSIK